MPIFIIKCKDLRVRHLIETTCFKLIRAMGDTPGTQLKTLHTSPTQTQTVRIS